MPVGRYWTRAVRVFGLCLALAFVLAPPRGAAAAADTIELHSTAPKSSAPPPPNHHGARRHRLRFGIAAPSTSAELPRNIAGVPRVLRSPAELQPCRPLYLRHCALLR